MGLCQWLQARGHRGQHDSGEGGEKGHAGIFLCSVLGAERHFLAEQLVTFSVTGQGKRCGRKKRDRISAGRSRILGVPF